jgi:Peptidase_C39 like family
MVNTQDIPASRIETPPSTSASAPVSAPGTVDLITLARQFHNQPQQVKLVQWFQGSTGAQKQAEFALMWRDGQPGGAIDFVKVFQSYQALPHQNAALKWLEQSSQPQTMAGLDKMWKEWSQAAKAAPPQAVRLAIPYYQQVDNRFEPMRTCNTSSCAMVAKFLGARILGDDDYYQYVRKYGDTTDHTAQTRALADLGVKSTWRTNLGFADLDASLSAGLPVVIGILHRGTLASPTGGHMIVVIGATASRDYICHDPFGSLLDAGGGYTGNTNNGCGVVYPRSILNRRWLPEGDKSGWGRVFW